MPPQLTEQQVIEIVRRELASAYHSGRKIEEKPLTQFLDGRNISFGGGTGTKLATTNLQKIGFWGGTPQVRPTNGADLTNNVTSGGSSDVIADFSDLTTYSNSAATIRNDIYQLARKLKIVNDALRSIGLMS